MSWSSLPPGPSCGGQVLLPVPPNAPSVVLTNVHPTPQATHRVERRAKDTGAAKAAGYQSTEKGDSVILMPPSPQLECSYNTLGISHQGSCPRRSRKEEMELSDGEKAAGLPGQGLKEVRSSWGARACCPPGTSHGLTAVYSTLPRFLSPDVHC